ncbi:hypothetical protein Hamer_G021691 [Homarus americanus]|uniref:Uncharacterized protein n=1 Tax=Homarus americanus TaxID=6706 RepID=A0A8J5MVH5_HOMAM|nr:hypothetical protein Hamer_G021691 [Homarus americanus]
MSSCRTSLVLMAVSWWLCVSAANLSQVEDPLMDHDYLDDIMDYSQDNVDKISAKYSAQVNKRGLIDDDDEDEDEEYYDEEEDEDEDYDDDEEGGGCGGGGGDDDEEDDPVMDVIDEFFSRS